MTVEKSRIAYLVFEFKPASGPRFGPYKNLVSISARHCGRVFLATSGKVLLGVTCAAPLRRMALDVGDRRIGIAVTDVGGLTVQGRPTLRRSSFSNDVAHIRALVAEEQVGEIVVGYPRHIDGRRTRQTEKTELFAERLRSELSVPVVLWDEALTSFEAEQQLEEMGMNWRRRRQHVDELAATLILEDYLRQRE